MLLICLLIFVVAISGYHYINNANLLALYLAFVAVSSYFLVYFKKKNDTKSNLAYIWLAFYWMTYNSLGFVHTAIIDKGLIPKGTYAVYCWFILATILMFLPIVKMQNKSSHNSGSFFSRFNNVCLNGRSVIFLVTLGFAINIYKLQAAGGFIAYVFSSYGAKYVDNSSATLFNVLDGFSSFFIYFLFPYLIKGKNKMLKGIIIFYLLYNIAISALGGASASLLTPFIAIFNYFYFVNDSVKRKRKVKKAVIVGVLIGIIGGMMIRVNRKDTENFKMVNLEIAYTEIMESPTFDNVTNLRTILNEMEPIYEFNQTILPYIHFIPRSTFPWKPMNLGRIVGVKFLGTSEDSMAAFLTSPLGDFYYDFGYIGMILGMLYVGFTFGYIVVNLNKFPKNEYTWGIIVAYISCFGGITSWYTGCFIKIVNLTILAIVVSYISPRLLKRKKNAN